MQDLDVKLVSPTMHAVGGVSFQTSGVDCAPKVGEEFIMGNYRLYESATIISLIPSRRTKGVDSSGATIYTWWKN